MKRRRSILSDLRVGLLCFSAGFIDVVGFISVLGAFVAHITSNLTIAGAAFTRDNPNYAFKLILLPVFIIAISGATVINHWARVRRFNPERILLSLEALFLIAFMVVGARLQIQATAERPAQLTIIAAASLAVFAMGVHNAATREARSMPTTTAMTSNLTQFVMDVTELCVFPANRSVLKSHSRRGAVVIGTFVIGAAVGTWAFLHWQFWSVSIPIAAILVLVIAPPPYSPIPKVRRVEPLADH